MAIDFVPLVSFVLVTTFTPGPNNISSASMGVLYGYRSTVEYMAGIAAGFFLVMLLCAYVSSTLLALVPAAEPVLRLAGAAYILWLAVGTARASWAFNGADQSPLGFARGFFLQAFNPKVAVYGLTIYSTFLAGVSDNLVILTASALGFALTTLCSISTWALGGVAIRNFLHRPKERALVNTIFVLLLVYAAFDLSGIATLVQ